MTKTPKAPYIHWLPYQWRAGTREEKKKKKKFKHYIRSASGPRTQWGVGTFKENAPHISMVASENEGVQTNDAPCGLWVTRGRTAPVRLQARYGTNGICRCHTQHLRCNATSHRNPALSPQVW